MVSPAIKADDDLVLNVLDSDLARRSRTTSSELSVRRVFEAEKDVPSLPFDAQLPRERRVAQTLAVLAVQQTR